MNWDYIREKRKKKFSVLWDAKVPRLPVISADDSESKAIDIKDKRYYFNKKTTKSGEVYLVCRIGRLAERKEKIGDKKEYDMRGLQEIFCNYTEFGNDTRRAIRVLQNRKEALLSFENDLKKEIEQSISLLQLQVEYAVAFFAYLRWSIKREEEYTRYNTVEQIKTWVEECKKEKNLSSRYFEFLPYRISKIRKYCNVNISNILLDKEDVGFIDFCTINGFNNLLALILLPYYSKGILDRFDTETIERVVKEVKVFLDMHILYEDYITSDDIEGE